MIWSKAPLLGYLELVQYRMLLVSTWYCSYCCETESLDLVFLMMSKEEGFYVQERPSYINVLGRKSVSGSEC